MPLYEQILNNASQSLTQGVGNVVPLWKKILQGAQNIYQGSPAQQLSQVSKKYIEEPLYQRILKGQQRNFGLSQPQAERVLAKADIATNLVMGATAPLKVLKSVPDEMITLYHASPNLPIKGNWRENTYFAPTEQSARYYAESHHLGDIKVQQVKIPKSLLFREPSTGNYKLTKEFPVAQKTPTLLAQEAQKYKSAEEFMRAQGETVYHGGGNIKEIDLNKTNFNKTFYFSDNANYAKSFGGKNSIVNEFTIDPKANIIDLRKPNETQIQSIKDRIDIYKSKPAKYGESFSFHPYSDKQVIQGIRDGKAHFAELPQIKEILKSLGYDGQITAEVPYAKNIGVWNKNVIKTKSQLTDIWNKVNKP